MNRILELEKECNIYRPIDITFSDELQEIVKELKERFSKEDPPLYSDIPAVLKEKGYLLFKELEHNPTKITAIAYKLLEELYNTLPTGIQLYLALKAVIFTDSIKGYKDHFDKYIKDYLNGKNNHDLVERELYQILIHKELSPFVDEVSSIAKEEDLLLSKMDKLEEYLESKFLPVIISKFMDVDINPIHLHSRYIQINKKLYVVFGLDLIKEYHAAHCINFLVLEMYIEDDTFTREDNITQIQEWCVTQSNQIIDHYAKNEVEDKLITTITSKNGDHLRLEVDKVTLTGIVSINKIALRTVEKINKEEYNQLLSCLRSVK